MLHSFQPERKFSGDSTFSVEALCRALRALDDQDSRSKKGFLSRTSVHWLFRHGTWVHAEEESASQVLIVLRRRAVVRGADSEFSLTIREGRNGGSLVAGRVRMVYTSWLPLLFFPAAAVVTWARGSSVWVVGVASLLGFFALFWALYLRNRNQLFRDACAAGALALTDDV